jgi:hypothetical protein
LLEIKEFVKKSEAAEHSVNVNWNYLFNW